MGITRIYLRNKVQQMIGRRTSIRHHENIQDKMIKQLLSREEGYRVKAAEERKAKEEKKQHRLDRKSELAIMNLKLLVEAIK